MLQGTTRCTTKCGAKGGATMSELADRLSKISNGPVTPCPVGKLLAEFDKETSEALQKALEGRVATRIIHMELTNSGIKIGRDTVAAHRNGWCRCKAAQA
jgi:hypothetical protein